MNILPLLVSSIYMLALYCACNTVQHLLCLWSRRNTVGVFSPQQYWPQQTKEVYFLCTYRERSYIPLPPCLVRTLFLSLYLAFSWLPQGSLPPLFSATGSALALYALLMLTGYLLPQAMMSYTQQRHILSDLPSAEDDHASKKRKSLLEPCLFLIMAHTLLSCYAWQCGIPGAWGSFSGTDLSLVWPLFPLLGKFALCAFFIGLCILSPALLPLFPLHFFRQYKPAIHQGFITSVPIIWILVWYGAVTALLCPFTLVQNSAEITVFLTNFIFFWVKLVTLLLIICPLLRHVPRCIGRCLCLVGCLGILFSFHALT